MKEIKKWFIWNGIASIALIGGLLTGHQVLAENIFSTIIGILLGLWFVASVFYIAADPKKFPDLIKNAKDMKPDYDWPFFAKNALDVLYILLLMKFGFDKLAFIFILEFPIMAYMYYSVGIFIKKAEETEKECNE